MKKRIVIIGGVAGGASAATRARRLCESADITIIERGPFVSFANCGLPYALGEVIQDNDALILNTAETIKERYNIDVFLNTEAVEIDSVKKTVAIENVKSKKRNSLSYDALILATGAESIHILTPGVDPSKIFTLQTIPDLERIQSFVSQHSSSKALVIGGGFIGLEVAENLRNKGVEVSLLERAPQVFAPVDQEIAVLVAQELERNGIKLFLGDEARSYEFEKDSYIAHLASGRNIAFDFIIMAIGVRPRSHLAKAAGLAIGEFNGVIVDEYMRTSLPDIYAVGDVIEYRHLVTGKSANIALAGPANRQGRIAADHIFGIKSAYSGTIGTSVCKIFDLTVGSVGLRVDKLKQLGISAESITVHPSHHAGYYPGAQALTLKVIFSPKDGKLLGAQCVGREGVDKRIDVLATAMLAKMNARDLANLELAYAPPYGSAKDPINMAGMVIENVLTGKVKILHAEALNGEKNSKWQIIDVRQQDEYDAGHIMGAKLIPLPELRTRLDEIDRAVPCLVYCRVGFRGYLASRILQENGYEVANLDGGYLTAEILLEEAKKWVP